MARADEPAVARPSCPAPASPRSMIVTAQPGLRQVVGAGRPDDPAADDDHPYAGDGSCADAHRERVGGVEDQGRLGVDVGRPPDARDRSGRSTTRYRPLEDAADEALLPPDLPLARACRRRPGRRAWRWCRSRRGSGRRPCRGRGRSSCCRPGDRRRAEQLDVVDLAAVVAADPRSASSAWRISPGDVGQPLEVGQVDRLAVVPRPGRTSCRPRRRRPTTVPRPGDVDRHVLGEPVARRRCRSRRGSAASRVAATTPTGVSIRCVPGPIRPRWARATATPIVPWPHMPR